MKLGMLLPTTKLVPSECLLILVIDASSAFLQPITEIADQKCNKTFYPNLPGRIWKRHQSSSNLWRLEWYHEVVAPGGEFPQLSTSWKGWRTLQLRHVDLWKSNMKYPLFLLTKKNKTKKFRLTLVKETLWHTHTQTQVGVWVKSPKMWDISTLLVITSTCLICLFPCCICFYKYPITTT